MINDDGDDDDDGLPQLIDLQVSLLGSILVAYVDKLEILLSFFNNDVKFVLSAH